MKKYFIISILLVSSLIWMTFGGNNSTDSMIPKKYVALTFDDWPDGNTTPLLLDILKSKNIHATFFMIGKNVQQFSGIVERVHAEWHMIGNHTWNHTELDWLSNGDIADEILKTQNAINKITWYTPILFRPPYGMQNKMTLKILHALHLASIQWSLDTNDRKLPAKEVLVQRIMDNVSPGSIILMHDTLTWTVKAMPQIIDELEKNGYTLVTVGELLWGYRYIHPGKIYRR